MGSKSKILAKPTKAPVGKKFKVGKLKGSKTTSTKVADIDSLDLNDIVTAAHAASKTKTRKLVSLNTKELKADQEKDKKRKEVGEKQATDAQSMIDQLDLL